MKTNKFKLSIKEVKPSIVATCQSCIRAPQAIIKNPRLEIKKIYSNQPKQVRQLLNQI